MNNLSDKYEVKEIVSDWTIRKRIASNWTVNTYTEFDCSECGCEFKTNDFVTKENDSAKWFVTNCPCCRKEIKKRVGGNRE